MEPPRQCSTSAATLDFLYIAGPLNGIKDDEGSTDQMYVVSFRPGGVPPLVPFCSVFNEMEPAMSTFRCLEEEQVRGYDHPRSRILHGTGLQEVRHQHPVQSASQIAMTSLGGILFSSVGVVSR